MDVNTRHRKEGGWEEAAEKKYKRKTEWVPETNPQFSGESPD